MNKIALSDPRVLSVETLDCGETLIPLDALHPKVLIDDSANNVGSLEYTPVFSVRESVANKLVLAAETLPADLAILVKEALRPSSYQQFIFNRRLNRLASENTGLSESQLIELTSRFIAPPGVAGHPTGGAIDVTLCSLDAQELDMGCAYDEDEHKSEGRCLSFTTDLDIDAKENRALLFNVLNGQGFINYPFEWWHWSFGDKYWAAIAHASHAIYGVVDKRIAY